MSGLQGLSTPGAGPGRATYRRPDKSSTAEPRFSHQRQGWLVWSSVRHTPQAFPCLCSDRHIPNQQSPEPGALCCAAYPGRENFCKSPRDGAEEERGLEWGSVAEHVLSMHTALGGPSFHPQHRKERELKEGEEPEMTRNPQEVRGPQSPLLHPEVVLCVPLYHP